MMIRYFGWIFFSLCLLGMEEAPYGFVQKKPQPVKAVISPHLMLGGRALAFFDEENQLIGKWRLYGGYADLRKEDSNEKNKFSDMDISCLKIIEDRSGDTPSTQKKVIEYKD